MNIDKLIKNIMYWHTTNELPKEHELILIEPTEVFKNTHKEFSDIYFIRYIRI